MMYQHILDLLPYKSSFRFVDEISLLDEDRVIGHYTLKEDAFFYEDHFPGNPVTPGAILTEIMAQIGLVVLGIYLVVGPAPANAPAATAGDSSNRIFPLFTSVEVSFNQMVLPGQKITVISQKEYFRFGKLKCRVEMQDAAGNRIAKGVFAGIIKTISKLKTRVE
jgi:3-hydroxyacyl-[acyl-carrier-protein] dehydratase